jgi:glutamine synthetase
VVPDPSSSFLDPFAETPTLVMICNVRDLSTGRWCARDARSIAQRAEAHLRRTTIEGIPSFRLELGSLALHEPNDYRRHLRAFELLENAGVEIEGPRRVGNGGDDAVAMRDAPLTRAADNLMIYTYIVRNLVQREAMTPSSPGRAIRHAASEMRVHQSIWRKGRPLFAGDGHSGSSAIMRHYVAGLIEHAPALLGILALTSGARRKSAPDFNPSLQSGFLRRSCAATRCISIYSPAPRAMSVGFCCPSASCNPYLTFAAMLLAGIDGFNYRMYDVEPDEPLARFFASRSHRPDKWLSASGALDSDQEFLLTDGIFTRDVIAMLTGKRSPPGDGLVGRM